ncbi:hypothetical protein TVAG_187950 [Trichomonas vaginalis G3]|uniref:Uncharacterized protein n=1 Tax=Trichomonas vaginalis (strain ATCC PRA-98 / G3) TaxID=412133 RepID=A2DV17_TRIV3|nr:hypothetical protein TVAGG3_0940630 [Trichomonas vaginalis G3]EAY15744.1 hypothetical protein TVAG_187950 [Trichomonas vaginalis G3]KAI5486519.1 hypothetical protein TVAGG3_0940630 [Trichomonas vaginalis G3]|eukprot:XP_001327967.1 hypothetical protein [Trichomonas vaginalis G3]
MAKPQIKIRAFIFNIGTPNEVRLKCTANGLPDLGRKKRRELALLKNVIQNDDSRPIANIADNTTFPNEKDFGEFITEI